MAAPSRPGSRWAVVLAGGESRRFGADKLAAAVDGRTLLDQAIAALPEDLTVLVVGPERPVSRTVRFVRERPPGGGPAAGMVTGVAAALAAGAREIVVLPGDAPHAGRAAQLLLDALAADPTALAVVGTDATGFEQPLQLALRSPAAEALVAAAGDEGGRGGSARALVRRLHPPALRHPLPPDSSYDIDTPAQLRTWNDRSSTNVTTVLAALDALAVTGRPVVVALDGYSGAGKSRLATALALRSGATVVSGDDFYSPRLAPLTWPQRDQLSDREVSEQVFDWRRLRTEALEPLRRGEQVRYAPYDWQAGDGRMARPVTRGAAEVVVVDGVYSARPELADVMDLAVLVEADEELRRRRLGRRLERGQGHERAWQEFWLRGEQYYFTSLRPPSSFDLRVHVSAALAR